MISSLYSTALMLFAVYIVRKLYYKRYQHNAHLPQMPKSFLFGHLRKLNEMTKREPTDRHTDYVFNEMLQKAGNPPLMFIDLWPVHQGIVLIADHDLGEQITASTDAHPASLPRLGLTALNPVIGETSILFARDEWKSLRKRFNPGFAPQHVKTLLPLILDKTPVFTDRLDDHVRTETEFSLVDLIISLIFDIIGSVVIDTDLKAQRVDKASRSELIRLYSEIVALYQDHNIESSFLSNPRLVLGRRRLGKRIDEILTDLIRKKHAEIHSADAKPGGASRSILTLSLLDIDTLTPELVKTISDQIKTFLFAGYDTTSTTLAWLFYELSRTPHALQAIRSELDTVLGPNADPEAIRACLYGAEGPDMLWRMPYTTAVIKETLRLYPPSGTQRITEANKKLTVHAANGNSYRLDGEVLYVCPSIMHRDQDVYGDTADEFVPERWLQTEQAGGKGAIPSGAWRAFGRGPRTCIAQDFAMNEMRIIVALVARRYDFVKVGLGQVACDEGDRPRLQENGQYAVVTPLYQASQITAKPADSMMVKVRLASAASKS
jgi:cytochrome P450